MRADRPHRRSRKSENGILVARPGLRAKPLQRGLHKLAVGTDRDGLLFVPDSCKPAERNPLALVLHGAGGNAHDGVQALRVVADELAVILVAPDSRAPSWDAMKGGWGPDVDFIDHALGRAFELCAVDPARIAITGFSDGASYALSLGLANGDLFSHVVAFSPGFMRAPSRQGKPKVFVSHGSGDLVLPAARCSRRIVSALRREDYEVVFREFEGEHVVPREIAREAMRWFLST